MRAPLSFGDRKFVLDLRAKSRTVRDLSDRKLLAIRKIRDLRAARQLIDAEQPEAGLLAKLNARHSRWMADRERFPELLNKGGAPERVLKLVASATGEMASRIAQLRSHIHRHGVTN